MSQSSKKPKRKEKLPKDVEGLTGDEVMERVFNKRVVKKLKEVAHDEKPKKPDKSK